MKDEGKKKGVSNIQKRLKYFGSLKKKKISTFRVAKFRRLMFVMWYGFFICLTCAVALSFYFPNLLDRFVETSPEIIKTFRLENEGPRNKFVKVIKGTPSLIYIVDADTMDIRGTRVRFSGISADEKGSPSYDSCKIVVSQIISQGSGIICYLSGKMSYGREVGDCYVVNNGVEEDIQRLIVEAGCARDCPRYSGGYYEQFEVEDSKKLNFPNYCK